MIQQQSTPSNALAIATPFTQKAATLKAKYFAMVVTDDESKKIVLEGSKLIMATIKETKEAHTKAKEPQKLLNEQFDAAFKPVIALLDGIKAQVGKNLLAYEQEQKKKREAELEEARLEKERKEEEARALLAKDVTPAAKTWDEMLMDPAESQIKKEQENVMRTVASEQMTASAAKDFRKVEKAQEADRLKGVRKVPKIRITDASKIPRGFLIPDESAIRAHILKRVKEWNQPEESFFGPDAVIDGVEYYEEETFAGRS